GSEADGWVNTLTLQADGKILMGGGFSAVNGQPRALIARLNADGTLDDRFAPQASSGISFGSVFTTGLQADGRILVGGNFNRLGGQVRNRIGRFYNTEPASQDLSYAASTVTWLRGGTSPELSAVSFSHSGDGSSWTNLGTGTRVPGGWRLTGI